MTFNKAKAELKLRLLDERGYLYCENCGVSNPGWRGFNVHHIIYRSEKPKHKNLHDQKNLIHICCDCHDDFHAKKSNRNQLVINRNLNQLFNE